MLIPEPPNRVPQAPWRPSTKGAPGLCRGGSRSSTNLGACFTQGATLRLSACSMELVILTLNGCDQATFEGPATVEPPSLPEDRYFPSTLFPPPRSWFFSMLSVRMVSPSNFFNVRQATCRHVTLGTSVSTQTLLHPFINNNLQAVAACSSVRTAVHPRKGDLAPRTLTRCRAQLGLSQSVARWNQERHWFCRNLRIVRASGEPKSPAVALALRTRQDRGCIERTSVASSLSRFPVCCGRSVPVHRVPGARWRFERHRRRRRHTLSQFFQHGIREYPGGQQR